MNAERPSAAQAKNAAKRLRGTLADQGRTVSHSESLEMIARQNGYRDWNSFLAVIGNAPPVGWRVGEQVTGTYLSQDFRAEVTSVSEVKSGWFRLALKLDTPIDVVTSEHFSNVRKRIRGTVGPKGHSVERTSDGVPILRVDM
ncbi:glyoxalase superfamily protein [Shimia sp. Alg240-R146]|uniref:glyoxalase superfamily protein n=1 Tax=Shimia sp. Alg240-R146 TaxID=2993449 RepID=UPI0022E6CFF5|nr:glyoxalase superfamily protein [Shimia sp. Alg240-R146]